MTRLTRSVVEVSSSPRRTAAVSGEASNAASSPAISRVSVRTPLARELGEEPAEHLGQRQVRRDRPGRLGREQRGVDRVARRPPVEDVEDLVGDLLGDEDLGLGRRGAEVRRQERVRRVEQRRAGRRLVLEDVDPGAAELARRASASATAASSRIAAAGDVEERSRRASSGRSASRPIRPRVVRVSGTWTVIDVGALEQRRRTRPARRRGCAACSAVTNGSDAEDGHLHRPRPDGDRLADLAEPDDAERPAAQLEPGELGPLPLAAADRGVGRGDLAGDAVQQGERVLGGRDRVAGRGVDDGDPGPRRRVEVDVVDADPGPADDRQPGARRRSASASTWTWLRTMSAS